MRSWQASEAGAVTRAYAWTVVKLRWLIVLGWAAGAAAALVWLPSTVAGVGLRDFAPPNSRAIQTETTSVKAFGFPILSRTVLVQHDPHGLPASAQVRAVARAVAVTQGALHDAGIVRGALPVTNTLGVFPSSSQPNTTALTYLFFQPGTSFADQSAAAHHFAAQHVNQPDDHFVGVTGSVPARVEQTQILYGRLPLLEGATLAVVIAVVALKFRSVGAPLVALVTAAAAYFMAVRVTDEAGALFHTGVPSDLKPLVLALVLGIVTDYSIFFLSGLRSALDAGEGRLAAARTSAAQNGRIVLIAGLAVAAGTAAMLVAREGFFRALGPVLSLSVATAVAVSLTLLPALLAIFGATLFWPSKASAEGEHRWIRLVARGLTTRLVALVVAGACIAGLVILGTAAGRLRLGVSFIGALPADSQAKAAADAAAAGFAPGIVSPTELLLQGSALGGDHQGLSRLGDELRQQPGVAGVISPGDLPQQLAQGALVTRSGDAARYVVILDHEPFGATAIGDVNGLSAVMPSLLHKAGLDGIRYGLAGDTAVASELVAATQSDLVRIAVAVLVVNLVLLMLFLRAVVAPVLLLACSVLGLTASMGCLVLIFQERLSHSDVTFYVPFAASVLLLSLGSDYNIYGVGHIWRRAERTTLRSAIVERYPETSGAITAAGFTLAASFGMLALVPLRPLHEMAFVMVVGVLLDAFIVRSLLVPSLLTLLGRFSSWPRRPRRQAAAEPGHEPPRSSATDLARSSAQPDQPRRTA